MSTLDELLRQKEALTRQIADLQNESRTKAIEDIRSLMAQHGLTSADLMPATAGKRRGAAAPRVGEHAKVAAKYRDPSTGSTWSGRGLKPRWLSTAIAAGKSLADFAI